MTDELTLVGILSERDFDAVYSLRDLKKHFFDCLQLGPMYDPLEKLLDQQGKVSPHHASTEYDMSTVRFKDIYSTLNSTAFLQSTPKVKLLKQ